MYYMNIFCIFIISAIYGFIIKPPMKRNILLREKKNDKEPIIFSSEQINELIEEYDFEALFKNHNIRLPPQCEEEIEEDSFEGYLKQHFIDIMDARKINKDGKQIIDFETFYSWRINIGTVLTKNEIEQIYNSITYEKEGCDVMDFILVNKVIDENDGADYS